MVLPAASSKAKLGAAENAPLPPTDSPPVAIS